MCESVCIYTLVYITGLKYETPNKIKTNSIDKFLLKNSVHCLNIQIDNRKKNLHKNLMLCIAPIVFLNTFFLSINFSSKKMNRFYSLLNNFYEQKQTHNTADTFLVHMDTRQCVGTVSVYNFFFIYMYICRNVSTIK